jgi:hypothetical protein
VIKFIKSFFNFGDRPVAAHRILGLVAKHKKRVRAETWKDCEKRIRQIQEVHRQEMIIARKDFEITIAEKEMIIKGYREHEQILEDKERDIVETQAKLSLAARKLNLHLTRMGKTVLKSGEECQGIFENVERLIK